jgi:hypothetical protein
MLKMHRKKSDHRHIPNGIFDAKKKVEMKGRKIYKNFFKNLVKDLPLDR